MAPVRTRLLVAVSVLLAVTGCSSAAEVRDDLVADAEPTVPSVPEPTGPTFEVQGVITVRGVEVDDGCAAPPGSDLREGAPVVVSLDDEPVAVGELDEGEPGADRDDCEFAFEVDDVPDVPALYTLQVADREPLEYSRARLAGVVRLDG